MNNGFEMFDELPIKMQREALREAEVLLNAQLQAAGAADQRALTWGGFLIATATAAIGGGIALLIKEDPESALGSLAVIFGASLLYAASLAVPTARPALFCFPGLRPGLWLPEPDELKDGAARQEQVARRHRAKQMDEFIRNNMSSSAIKAEKINASFRWTWGTILLSGLALALVLVGRSYTIREPTSEIMKLGGDHSDTPIALQGQRPFDR